MKYMGSKARIPKHILPIILENRKEDQWYVEPFVGGANMIDKVGGKRIGSDNNKYLIEALKLIQNNPKSLPDLVTEEDYKKARKKLSKFSDGIIGYIGFAMSFGGKWFGGYRRDVAGTKGCIKNMKVQSRRSKESAIKQSKSLQNVIFLNKNYLDLEIPKNSIIYCDPPYKNTTKYNTSFNYDVFWDWIRSKNKEGHVVFVSEYSAPKDFKSIWQKEVNNTLVKNTGEKKGIEKLFIKI